MERRKKVKRLINSAKVRAIELLHLGKSTKETRDATGATSQQMGNLKRSTLFQHLATHRRVPYNPRGVRIRLPVYEELQVSSFLLSFFLDAHAATRLRSATLWPFETKKKAP